MERESRLPGEIGGQHGEEFRDEEVVSDNFFEAESIVDVDQVLGEPGDLAGFRASLIEFVQNLDPGLLEQMRGRLMNPETGELDVKRVQELLDAEERAAAAEEKVAVAEEKIEKIATDEGIRNAEWLRMRMEKLLDMETDNERYIALQERARYVLANLDKLQAVPMSESRARTLLDQLASEKSLVGGERGLPIGIHKAIRDQHRDNPDWHFLKKDETLKNGGGRSRLDEECEAMFYELAEGDVDRWGTYWKHDQAIVDVLTQKPPVALRGSIRVLLPGNFMNKDGNKGRALLHLPKYGGVIMRRVELPEKDLWLSLINEGKLPEDSGLEDLESKLKEQEYTHFGKYVAPNLAMAAYGGILGAVGTVFSQISATGNLGKHIVRGLGFPLRFVIKDKIFKLNQHILHSKMAMSSLLGPSCKADSMPTKVDVIARTKKLLNPDLDSVPQAEKAAELVRAMYYFSCVDDSVDRQSLIHNAKYEDDERADPVADGGKSFPVLEDELLRSGNLYELEDRGEILELVDRLAEVDYGEQLLAQAEVRKFAADRLQAACGWR